MAYRSIASSGGNLDGYVNWTLSSFPLSGYNLTNTVPDELPQANITFCR